MKVLVLVSFLSLAAAQWQQWDNSVPQENNWDFRRPAVQPAVPQENHWDFRRPVEQPQGNNWDFRRPVEQPIDNSIPVENNWDFRRPAPQPAPQENNWDFRRPLQNWNNQPIRVPPQPIETEPWLLRPENRCPQPEENSYHWALIIPHWRDQSSLVVCMGGVAIPFACPPGFVFVQAEQTCIGTYQRFPFAIEEQKEQ